MGRPHAAAMVNLVGYFVIALPLAYVLAFRLRYGLVGIWIALAIGLIIVAVTLLFWVRRTVALPLSELSVELEQRA
jgi:MATE family multidrug resistance protein